MNWANGGEEEFEYETTTRGVIKVPKSTTMNHQEKGTCCETCFDKNHWQARINKNGTDGFPMSHYCKNPACDCHSQKAERCPACELPTSIVHAPYCGDDCKFKYAPGTDTAEKECQKHKLGQVGCSFPCSPTTTDTTENRCFCTYKNGVRYWCSVCGVDGKNISTTDTSDKRKCCKICNGLRDTKPVSRGCTLPSCECHTSDWRERFLNAGTELLGVDCSALISVVTTLLKQERNKVAFNMLDIAHKAESAGIEAGKAEATKWYTSRPAYQMGKKDGEAAKQAEIREVIEQERVKLARKMQSTHYSFVFDDLLTRLSAKE